MRSRSPGAEAPTRIVVSGGKGGVGKTVVAVNLAILAQEAGFRTLLADLDPGLGNVDVHLRIAADHSIEDLADDSCSVRQAVVPGPGGVSVLTASSASTRLASGDPDFLARTRAALERASRGFDVVICDTGAGIGPQVIETLRTGDVNLAVTTPDPAAVTDAYALCKVMRASDMAIPQVVVNRASSRDHAITTGNRLAQVCERFLGSRPETVGWLPNDTEIENSVLQQRPAVLTKTACAELRALGATLLSRISRPARARAERTDTARRLFARA